MYAFPRTADADARLWAGVRDRLRRFSISAPESLTPAPRDLLAHWTEPDLVLSQTCGRPFKEHLLDKVQLVGTPDYGLANCPPGYYRSLVVARVDDTRQALSSFATARFAVNEPGSQSGWAALAAEVPEVLAGPKVGTGSHRASVLAVRSNAADFAAIDAVTWRHLAAAGDTMDLRIIHRTEPRPGLPYITSLSQDAGLIRDALGAAITALSGTDRDVLGLRGLVDISVDAYRALPDPEASAI